MLGENKPDIPKEDRLAAYAINRKPERAKMTKTGAVTDYLRQSMMEALAVAGYSPK